MKNTGRPTLDEYSQLKIWTAASVPVRLPMSAIGQKRTFSVKPTFECAASTLPFDAKRAPFL